MYATTCASTEAREPFDRCPFCPPSGTRCSAAFSGQPLTDRHRMRYCESEEHDRCAVFLARVLRASRPRLRGLERDLDAK